MEHAPSSHYLQQIAPIPSLVSFSGGFQSTDTHIPAEAGAHASISNADRESRESLTSGLEVSRSHIEATFNSLWKRSTLAFYRWGKWGPVRICESPGITQPLKPRWGYCFLFLYLWMATGHRLGRLLSRIVPAPGTGSQAVLCSLVG